MKLLVALRVLALAVAALSIVLPWLAPAVALPRLPLLRRVAIAVGLGAQLGLTSLDAARGRSPWTRLLFPAIGVFAAIEWSVTSTIPFWALGLVGACEITIVASVVLRALRVARALGNDCPETILEREYARLVDARAARFLALETSLVLAAAKLAFGGFRRSVPAGFSYTRQSDIPLLLALPVFVSLPEMIVVDLLIPPGHWGWRLASDALHVYAMLWALGAYAMFRNRPHLVGNGRARFSLGAIRTLCVDTAQIVSATVRPGTFDRRAWRRAHAADGWSLMVSGAPVVEIELAAPLAVAGLHGVRNVRRLTVSADRPHDFARALLAT